MFDSRYMQMIARVAGEACENAYSALETCLQHMEKDDFEGALTHGQSAFTYATAFAEESKKCPNGVLRYIVQDMVDASSYNALHKTFLTYRLVLQHVYEDENANPAMKQVLLNAVDAMAIILPYANPDA